MPSEERITSPIGFEPHEVSVICGTVDLDDEPIAHDKIHPPSHERHLLFGQGARVGRAGSRSVSRFPTHTLRRPGATLGVGDRGACSVERPATLIAVRACRCKTESAVATANSRSRHCTACSALVSGSVDESCFVASAPMCTHPCAVESPRVGSGDRTANAASCPSVRPQRADRSSGMVQKPPRASAETHVRAPPTRTAAAIGAGEPGSRYQPLRGRNTSRSFHARRIPASVCPSESSSAVVATPPRRATEVATDCIRRSSSAATLVRRRSCIR